MKKSFRKRVAVSFIALMVLTLLAIGAFSYAFVERYYIANKQDILVDSFEYINILTSSDELSLQEFSNFCAQNSLIFALADGTLRFLGTNSRDGEDMVNQLFGSIMNIEQDNSEVIFEADDYQVLYFTDEIDYLQLFGQLDNGYYYVVRYPMYNIREAASLSLRFYIMVGCIILAASTVVILMMTRKLTAPLEELNVLSKRMAELDFDAEYTSGGEDEIGQLGANFNAMSHNLERAISELKSANIRLERDIKEKEELDEKRREFLSNVSHDLKTPIALIQGYAEGLRAMSQDADNRDFYCEVIIDEAQRMNRLVRQLLSLDEIENGAYCKIEMLRFNISEMIGGIVNSSSLMTEKKGMEIINDFDKPVYVWGDELMIEEVFTNYFTNALNHVSKDMKIHLTYYESNGITTISVFNTGEPIPEDEIDSIWEKFYKVDKARTRQYGGSGIGLSIVKAIMERHGQKCWAENYENGVAFKFTLESR